MSISGGGFAIWLFSGTQDKAHGNGESALLDVHVCDCISGHGLGCFCLSFWQPLYKSGSDGVLGKGFLTCIILYLVACMALVGI